MSPHSKMDPVPKLPLPESRAACSAGQKAALALNSLRGHCQACNHVHLCNTCLCALCGYTAQPGFCRGMNTKQLLALPFPRFGREGACKEPPFCAPGSKSSLPGLLPVSNLLTSFCCLGYHFILDWAAQLAGERLLAAMCGQPKPFFPFLGGSGAALKLASSKASRHWGLSPEWLPPPKPEDCQIWARDRTGP